MKRMWMWVLVAGLLLTAATVVLADQVNQPKAMPAARSNQPKTDQPRQLTAEDQAALAQAKELQKRLEISRLELRLAELKGESEDAIAKQAESMYRLQGELLALRAKHPAIAREMRGRRGERGWRSGGRHGRGGRGMGQGGERGMGRRGIGGGRGQGMCPWAGRSGMGRGMGPCPYSGMGPEQGRGMGRGRGQGMGRGHMRGHGGGRGMGPRWQQRPEASGGQPAAPETQTEPKPSAQ